MIDEKPVTFDVSLSSPFERWGGVEPMAQAAQLAEELGFFGVQFGEHVVTPLGPGVSPSGLVWYDNFLLAAHLATLTKRLRLIFNAMVVPYRPAVQAAKAVATLDVVSQGRIVVSMAVGWFREEFEALGIPFEQRGAITDDYIKAMKALWTEERPVFNGRYVAFRDIAFLPKCVQKPHVPLWIAGTGPRSMRRAVELGDGWCPNSGTPDELAERIASIKERVRAAGRDPSSMTFAYSIGIGEPPQKRESRVAGGRYYPAEPADTPERVIDLISRYRDVGVDHISLRFDWETPLDFMRRMEWFAANVMRTLADRAATAQQGGPG